MEAKKELKFGCVIENIFLDRRFGVSPQKQEFKNLKKLSVFLPATHHIQCVPIVTIQGCCGIASDPSNSFLHYQIFLLI